MERTEQITWAIETAISLMRENGYDGIADGLIAAQEEITKLKAALEEETNSTAYKESLFNTELRQEIERLTTERDKYRQEARDERELSEDIVGEREALIIQCDAYKEVLEKYEKAGFEVASNILSQYRDTTK